MHDHQHHEGCDHDHDHDHEEADHAASLAAMFPNASHKTPKEMTPELKRLWQDHRKGSIEARNRLVEEYFGIVEANVRNVIETILQAVEESDFHQAGMVGYLEAFEEFAEDGSTTFEDFSSMKIRQAILAELSSFISE